MSQGCSNFDAPLCMFQVLWVLYQELLYLKALVYQNSVQNCSKLDFNIRVVLSIILQLQLGVFPIFFSADLCNAETEKQASLLSLFQKKCFQYLSVTWNGFFCLLVFFLLFFWCEEKNFQVEYYLKKVSLQNRNGCKCIMFGNYLALPWVD